MVQHGWVFVLLFLMVLVVILRMPRNGGTPRADGPKRGNLS